MSNSYTAPDFLKIPPYSLDAEQSVLGGLMLDNEAWDKIADYLQATDFYRQEHQLIFHAIFELAQQNQPFDVLTLKERLKTNPYWKKLTLENSELYLLELAKNTPSAANIKAYATIVKDNSLSRRLLQITNKTQNQIFSPEGRSVKEILEDAEQRLFQITEQDRRGTGPLPISEWMAKSVDQIHELSRSKKSITGVSTAYSDLDNLTSGLQFGDLIVIAGRPSMGKTSLAMNIAEHAALQEAKSVLIFSMEMPGEALAMRLISSLGRIDQHKLRTGQLEDRDWPRLTSAISILSAAKLFIDDTPALSPSDIRARARRLVRAEGPLSLIVIDYLQLMQMPGARENRAIEVSEIARALKTLAKELHVPVIALSQLNRGLEQRADKRPIMSDLRDSGAIEQDADLILFIYRDEVYNENSPEKGKAEIIIAKQRNGPTGKIRLTFLGKYTRFESFTVERS